MDRLPHQQTHISRNRMLLLPLKVEPILTNLRGTPIQYTIFATPIHKTKDRYHRSTEVKSPFVEYVSFWSGTTKICNWKV